MHVQRKLISDCYLGVSLIIPFRGFPFHLLGKHRGKIQNTLMERLIQSQLEMHLDYRRSCRMCLGRGTFELP